ncbi:hypothetical protein Tco_1510818 [Tanacetum coccineum]
MPSSWSQVALTLKTKGGLELHSFYELYYKLKTVDLDIKGNSTVSSSHSAFVSTTSASKKMSYADIPNYSSFTYTAPSNSKTGSYRSGNVIEDVLQSFVADTEPEQQLAYEDFEQIEKIDLEEMDLKWLCFLLEYTSLSRKLEGRLILIRRNLIEHDGQSDGVITSKEFGMIAGCDTEDAIEEEHDGQSDGVITSKEFGMIAGCDTEDAIEEGAAKFIFQSSRYVVPTGRVLSPGRVK